MDAPFADHSPLDNLKFFYPERCSLSDGESERSDDDLVTSETDASSNSYTIDCDYKCDLITYRRLAELDGNDENDDSDISYYSGSDYDLDDVFEPALDAFDEKLDILESRVGGMGEGQDEDIDVDTIMSQIRASVTYSEHDANLDSYIIGHSSTSHLYAPVDPQHPDFHLPDLESDTTDCSYDGDSSDSEDDTEFVILYSGSGQHV